MMTVSGFGVAGGSVSAATIPAHMSVEKMTIALMRAAVVRVARAFAVVRVARTFLAPKGRLNPAQGNALGCAVSAASPERAQDTIRRPFRAGAFLWRIPRALPHCHLVKHMSLEHDFADPFLEVMRAQGRGGAPRGVAVRTHADWIGQKERAQFLEHLLDGRRPEQQLDRPALERVETHRPVDPRLVLPASLAREGQV